ncbi:MAG TPA: hypothetical protein VFY87_17605, partial [Geminicoccaceae bacterium]|nr:hypothetical protein [Geminicoccaceae bacterium]
MRRRAERRIRAIDLEPGGAVFSTGSIAYAGSLSWNGYDNNVCRLTSNVLRRFADPADECPLAGVAQVVAGGPGRTNA